MQLVLYSFLVWLAPAAIHADPMSAPNQPFVKHKVPLRADIDKSQVPEDSQELVVARTFDLSYVSDAEGGYSGFSTLEATPQQSIVHTADSREYLNVSQRDNSLIGRLSRVRSLSIVTFLETAKTRIFLGVNRDGRPGIHFNTRARGSDSRHLELYHMPYLSEED